MTERAMQYGKALYELNLSNEIISDSLATIEGSVELREALDNPAVRFTEKEKVIDKLFDKKIASFLKVVTSNHMIGEIQDIFESCHDCEIAAKNMVKATLYYVTKPDKKQLDAIKDKIAKETGKDGVELDLVSKPSLIGGFVLKINDFETDRSIKGHLEQLTANLMRR